MECILYTELYTVLHTVYVTGINACCEPAIGYMLDDWM